ncbi:MAG TPA: hypothetical protein VKY45_00195 [Marinilabiliaceae bacterium]|nr:hypothetical protein [Marinilabiliaceae bacterium]
MKRKKTYRSPIIELVKIDRELVLLQGSEENPPNPPGPELPASQSNSFEKNNLNDNPFEK